MWLGLHTHFTFPHNMHMYMVIVIMYVTMKQRTLKNRINLKHNSQSCFQQSQAKVRAAYTCTKKA